MIEVNDNLSKFKRSLSRQFDVMKKRFDRTKTKGSLNGLLSEAEIAGLANRKQDMVRAMGLEESNSQLTKKLEKRTIAKIVKFFGERMK